VKGVNEVDSTTTESVIVKGTKDKIYDLWSDFENFPRFMKYIESITKIDDRTSHWTAKGPLNTHLDWYAEIIRDEKDRRISWKTLKGDIQTSGQVTFLDLPDNETQVTVTIKVIPPAGKLGKIFSDPTKRVKEDLRNFKNYAEGSSEQLPDKSNK
jgi:uncharacterized membrane protein